MRLYFASLLFAAGCSAAFADQVAAPTPSGPRIAIASANAKVRAPYDVEVIRDNGEILPTYAAKDRFYVQGNTADRYIIKVTNPTANRVEAVVTVDGLDVIDGQDGDLHKRGYVVPAYGEVRIEGFRMSQEDVATFRFSSVSNSYAGKTGKARNVGVIAAAIFEEQASEQQQIVVPEPTTVPTRGHYNYEDDLDARRDVSGNNGRVAHVDAKKKSRGADKAPASAPPADAPSPTASRQAPSPPPSVTRPSGAGEGGYGAPAKQNSNYDDADESESPVAQNRRQKEERPGLGTEFGEQRNSAATYTRFVRGNNRPIAIAELRYNDAAGLAALGINVQPLPDAGEIMTRETADPVPGDSRFSQPPR